ncbi:MAG: FeS-binding protein [Geobacteraceae bacterium GWC2_48_7]|nr:MAG: FeS-binding protein [Geobacteraceae bacterium GWC2_48_7]
MKSLVQSVAAPASNTAKPLYRWSLGIFMLSVIAIGWKYPLLGFAVPVAMLAGIFGGFFRGRYVCGNFCPRGSFYDTIFGYIGGNRPAPKFLQSSRFRWIILVVLMGFMTWRIAQEPGEWQHWGSVFWSMCLITTAVGIPLGMIYRSRSWCSFCPVGTIAATIGGDKFLLEIDHDCRQCGACEKQCPMGLSIAEHRDSGALPHGDCIKCSSCLNSCPREALSWPG